MNTPDNNGLICPACKIDLVLSERQGVEIDYCPKCRGVWLDRGELDKIIEKSTEGRSSQDGRGRSDYRGSDDRYEGSHGSHGGRGDHGRRKRGFLSELFD